MQAAQKKPRSQLVLWALIIAFGWVVWSHFGEFDDLLLTLRTGRPLWVAGAIMMQFVYFSILAGAYWSAFATVGVHTEPRTLIPLTFASRFLNATVTSGGAAGAALFVNDARRRGEPSARALAGTLLVLAADYVAYSILLTSGLILLIRQHDLTRLEGISALIMYGIVLALLALLGIGFWSPNSLHRLLHYAELTLSRVMGRLGRAAPLADGWGKRNAEEFIMAAAYMAQRPRQLAITTIIAMAMHCAALATLAMLFQAFNQSITVSMLIVIYAMTTLFTVVSPTPSGIGVVETVMPAIYVSVGVPLEAATIINLAFRGIMFWLPLLLGFFFLHRLDLFKSSGAEAETLQAAAGADDLAGDPAGFVRSEEGD